MNEDAEELQATRSHFDELCRKLNMDEAAGNEAWNSYERISKNYTLEGNALHWLACALYVSCRQMVPTVSNRTVEGNYVSLAKILHGSELSLIEFFNKMKKWEDMANLSQEFRERTKKLERNFTVSAVIFKKYIPIFKSIFREPHEEPQRQQRSRKQRISDDLVNSYHLLLCALDLVYGNALLCPGRKELLNPSFTGLPDDFSSKDYRAPPESPCIISQLCMLHDGLVLDAKGIKEHFWKPFIRKLFEKKILKGKEETLTGFLDPGNFGDSLKAITRAYEEYVLSMGSLDERIFLGEDASDGIGTPSRCVHPAASVDHRAHTQQQSDKGILEQDVFHRSLMACCLEIILFSYKPPGDFPWIIEIFDLPAYHFYKVIEVLIRTEDGLFREVVKHLDRLEEQVLESMAWKQESPLWEYIRGAKNKVPTCEEVMTPDQFEYPEGRGFQNSPLTSNRVNEIRTEAGRLVSSSPATLHDRYSSPAAGSARRRLFVDGDSNTESSSTIRVSQSPIVNTVPMQNVTADAMAITPVPGQTVVTMATATVTANNGQTVTIPVQGIANENGGITFIPVQVSVTGTPQSVTSPMQPLSAQSLAGPGLQVGGGIALQSPGQTQKKHLHHSPAGTRPRKTGSMSLFFRKVYRLVSMRLRDLCSKLDIPDELRRKVWTCFEHSLVQHPELMVDRHLDQLLMCAIYVMSKVTKEDKSFQNIMKCYRMQPQACSSSEVLQGVHKVRIPLPLGAFTGITMTVWFLWTSAQVFPVFRGVFPTSCLVLPPAAAQEIATTWRSFQDEAMGDTSIFTIKERLVATVWVHERPVTGKSVKNVMDDFVVRFGKASLTKSMLLQWEEKAFATGRVQDVLRSGRPSTRHETCADVAESVQRSPMKSTRKRAAELGIVESTMRKHIKQDLQMKCCHPLHVNELSDADLDRHQEA
ncbi:RBL2 protein, partial [Polypterus senegalus]